MGRKGGCDAKVVAEILAVACALRFIVKYLAWIVWNAIWSVKPGFWIDQAEIIAVVIYWLLIILIVWIAKRMRSRRKGRDVERGSIALDATAD